MTRRENIFFITWGMIGFPLLLLFLRLHLALDIPCFTAALTYMAGMKFVYVRSKESAEEK